MKKHIFPTLAVAFLLLGFLAVGPAHGADTIKIATFDPLSGPFKYIGDSYNWGMKFHIREWNEKEGGLFGKKIEVIPFDSQLKPDVAVRLATKAILEQKVQVIGTGTGSHIAKALAQVGRKYKTIVVSYGAEASSLTGPGCNPYFFRISLNTAQHSGALAAYFEDKPQVKKIGIICQDYNFGHEAAEDFKKALKKFRPDIQIVAEIYHPLMTKDFAPYITKLNDSGAQWVFTGNWGPDLGLLIKQGKNLGLKAKLACYFLEDGIQLMDVQDAAVGFITADFMSINTPTPEQESMNRRYHAIWREIVTSDNDIFQWPGTVVGKNYHIRMLFEAAKKVGKWDTKAIIKAWEGMRYHGINGEVYMRAEDHQIQTPITVVRIVPKEQNKWDPRYPGGKVETVIPIEKTTIPLEETGCTRKAGEF
jgi:branched-chain amino acid transport system substrate-binding protein